jgi:hypothetical protein
VALRRSVRGWAQRKLGEVPGTIWELPKAVTEAVCDNEASCRRAGEQLVCAA